MNLDVSVRLPLRHFDLRVVMHSEARVLGIYGRSGAGKTSLIETLCGLNRAARGTIRFDRDIWLDTEHGVSVPAHRRGVGYVPQGATVFPDRSVLANLRAGRRRGWFGRQRGAGGVQDGSLERRVIDVLELGPLLKASPAELSGGEAQRLALGRAILSGARVLLLDEPTASIGQEFRQRLLPFLARIQQEFRLPMIIVSHEALDLQYLCDDLVVLQRGQVVRQGSPHETLLGAPDPDHHPTSIFEGHIVSSDRYASRIELDADPEVSVCIAGAVARVGHRAIASISADQVLLSQSRPEGTSAMNVWPVVVHAVKIMGHHAFVEVELGSRGARLISEMTVVSLQRLSCAPGAHLFAMVKAVSVSPVAAP